jgi:hypothetical protein
VANCKVSSVTGVASLVLCTTSDTGKLEWIASNGDAIKIYLLGWIELPYSEGLVYSDAAFPNAWDKLVLGTITGMTYACALIRTTRTGGTANEIAYQEYGELSDFLDVGGIGGASQGHTNNTGKSTLYFLQTDTDGNLEHIADAVVPNGTVHLVSYGVDGVDWVQDGSVIAALNNPPVAYTDIDCSGITNNKRGLFLLKVERNGALAGTYVQFAFRADGSLVDYLETGGVEPTGGACCSIEASKATYVVVESDSKGAIEWISSNAGCKCTVTLVGYISANEAPVFYSNEPTGSTYPTKSVAVNCSDDTNVILGTLNMTFTSPSAVVSNVVVAGAFQAGYGGSISANAFHGYDIKVSTHPLFEVGIWTIYIECADIEGIVSTLTWQFTVECDPPYIHAAMPYSGECCITRPEWLRVSLADDYGIDLASIDVELLSTRGTSLAAVVGGVIQVGYMGSISANGRNGYDILLETPDLENLVNWTMVVDCENLAKVAM